MKDIKTDKIDEIAAKGDGLTVPKDYFANFAVKMAGQLPFREELDTPVAQQRRAKNSRWLQVRPYVYMAAMFAGAWCLIKMFSLMSPSTAEVNISNYPALSLALEDDQFVDEYIMDCVSSYDILEESYMYRFGDEEAAEDFVPESPEFAADETPGYILPTDNISNSTDAQI